MPSGKGEESNHRTGTGWLGANHREQKGHLSSPRWLFTWKQDPASRTLPVLQNLDLTRQRNTQSAALFLGVWTRAVLKTNQRSSRFGVDVIACSSSSASPSHDGIFSKSDRSVMNRQFATWVLFLFSRYGGLSLNPSWICVFC